MLLVLLHFVPGHWFNQRKKRTNNNTQPVEIQTVIQSKRWRAQIQINYMVCMLSHGIETGYNVTCLEKYLVQNVNVVLSRKVKDRIHPTASPLSASRKKNNNSNNWTNLFTHLQLLNKPHYFLCIAFFSTVVVLSLSFVHIPFVDPIQ